MSEWKEIRPSGLRNEWKVQQWIHGVWLLYCEGSYEGMRETVQEASVLITWAFPQSCSCVLTPWLLDSTEGRILSLGIHTCYPLSLE